MNEPTPLASFVNTKDTAWNFYLGGVIQVRETNSGLVQYRTADNIEWTTVTTREEAA